MKQLFQATLFFFIVLLFTGCETSPNKLKTLEDYLPEKSVAIIKIEDYEVLKADIQNNGIFSTLKDSEPYQFLKNNSLLNSIKPESKSFLCLTKDKESTDITFISKYSSGLFVADSLKNISIEEININNQKAQKVHLSNQTFYTAAKDSVFIASSSKNVLQQVLNSTKPKDPILKKIIHLKNNQDVTAYIPADDIITGDQSFSFASWAALDVEILPDGLTASGVVLANDSIPQLISVFKDIQPQVHEIVKTTPLDALGVTSLTYNDFEIFQNNLQKFRGSKGINIEETILFESIAEIGKISFSEGNVIVLKSLDTDLTNDALETFRTMYETYKNISIYSFNNPNLFENNFLTFTNKSTPKYVFNLGEFFIFSETKKLSEHLIDSYLNNNVLSEANYYREAQQQLSDESSLQIIKLNGNYSNSISNLLKSKIEEYSFKKYPLAILQFSHDRNFSHVNFVSKEASITKSKNTVEKVSQIASITIEEDLLGDPIFFNNHRTGGKDIIIQDISNTLYFISASGKTLWTKKLKSSILGEVKEVDILRNGKKQLAFATKNRVFILDRTGRDVGKFPIKFKDDITQPLSIFDYDSNRKYRFLVTQENEVLMLDSKGKRVKGFTFKKTTSKIVLPPQHIRISGKDYILIAERNGKLHILNRVGNSRLNIKKTFKFSNIPIALEGKKFVVITKDNTKHSISTNEKVSSLKLDVTSYWFTIKGKNKVTLDDNLMRINGKLADLPFGIYTAPKISTFKNRTYVSITETQENKVYVFSLLGDLLPGFPVYGTSQIDIGDASKNGKLNFITKGDTNEILLFEL